MVRSFCFGSSGVLRVHARTCSTSGVSACDSLRQELLHFGLSKQPCKQDDALLNLRRCLNNMPAGLIFDRQFARDELRSRSEPLQGNLPISTGASLRNGS
jgi:hypothetical protein